MIIIIMKLMCNMCVTTIILPSLCKSENIKNTYYYNNT